MLNLLIVEAGTVFDTTNYVGWFFLVWEEEMDIYHLP